MDYKIIDTSKSKNRTPHGHLILLIIASFMVVIIFKVLMFKFDVDVLWKNYKAIEHRLENE